MSEGLAGHLGWPRARVRALFVASAFLSGAGVLLYLWLWALMPLRPPAADEEDSVERRIPVPLLLFVLAVVAGIAAVVFAVVNASPGLVLGFVGVMIGFAICAVAWDQLIDETAADGARAPTASSSLPQTTARSWPTSPVSSLPSGAPLRVGSGAFLVVVALVLTVVPYRAGSGWLWLGVIAATFAGAAVLVAPWALRLSRELIAERTARIKEEQRAEIAAHLHDSVLQTLALIQNRAGASSEVARIARAQERELREWLYADDGFGSDTPVGDLAAQLRSTAAVLEMDHPVHIDVVAVGEPVPHPQPELAAAAREAMLNAARHAGGEVSVYVESTPRAVDVFVRDRGPGFDVDALPEGRLGVRESIIGRMRRAGGHATVSARDMGTEVHLTIERANEAP